MILRLRAERGEHCEGYKERPDTKHMTHILKTLDLKGVAAPASRRDGEPLHCQNSVVAPTLDPHFSLNSAQLTVSCQVNALVVPDCAQITGKPSLRKCASFCR